MADSSFSHHEACPDCGSSDSLSVFTDGGMYCWGTCEAKGEGYKGKKSRQVDNTLEDDEGFEEEDVQISTPTKKAKDTSKLIHDLEYVPLNKRGFISKNICEKFGYGIAEYAFKEGDTWVKQWSQFANYLDSNGKLIAQKIRGSNKDFAFIGDSKKTMLWGKHLWRNKGGRQIVVTEGEIDCLSVAQAQEGKYPVVSISAGANSAKECLLDNLDFLESFDKVILWFDSDEAGQKALENCKGIFSPQKLYYVPFDSQYKDANEVLIAEKTKGIISRLYEAVEHREDAIVRGSDISFSDMRKNIRAGRPMPYPKMQQKTQGSRNAELWIHTAGSGIGKSTIVTEIAKYQLDNDPDVNLGCVYLEESNDKTADRFMAIDHNVALKDLRLNHDLIDEEDAYITYEKYFKSNRINFYNHFGSVDPSKLMQKIRYLHHAEKCDTIVLDHISIAVSGLKDAVDERKMIDIFMTDLRSFVEETQCTIHAIVHLKRGGESKNFNEGASISLTDLRGSASLEQLSDAVVAYERDQQGENPYLCKVRILKCRETGETGLADTIEYVPETGRYRLYVEEEEQDEGFVPESNKKDF